MNIETNVTIITPDKVSFLGAQTFQVLPRPGEWLYLKGDHIYEVVQVIHDPEENEVDLYVKLLGREREVLSRLRKKERK